MNSIKLVRFIFAALLAFGTAAPALATHIGIGATVTTNAASPTQVTYNVTITNLSAVTFVNVLVTNQLSAAATINSAVHDWGRPPGADTVQIPDVTPPRVETVISSIAPNVVVKITLVATVATASDVASLDDVITVVAANEPHAFTASGSGAIDPTPDTRSRGDLTVFFVIPPNSNPIQGDFFDIGIVATNSGPGAVANIVLTNIFDGLVIRGVTPTQTITTNAAGEVPINVGTLQPNTAIQFTFNLTTTNSRTFELTSTIGSTNNVDPDLTNNSADFDLAVAQTNSPNVTVTIAAAQESTPDLQTGLFTEIVNVRNDSAATVPAFRLNVFGMNATNILYNAQGTNSGIPFVVYPEPVAPGGIARVLLEFFNSRRRPVPTTSTNYFVTELRSFNPTNSVTTTTNIFTWVTTDVGGDPVVNFPATVGNRYTIVYSDNAAFTNNVFRASPSFVAPGNIVQWRDTGPPKTLTRTPTRFYRVLEGQ
jgi:hypothetical protein